MDHLLSSLFNHFGMRIELKKFGTLLVSRPAGKEAYAAFLPTLNELKNDESIEIDFADVTTFSPS